jgi:hypothetical protein
MSACLRLFQWRSDAAIYPLCMSLAGRTGRARAALDGAVAVGSAPAGSASGLAGSVCGPGKTARRRGSRWRRAADSVSWPACPASTSRSRASDRMSLPGAGRLCRWRRPPAGTPARCQDCRTRHRPRPPLVPVARSRACPGPGPGGMRRRPAAPDDPRVPAALAPRRRQRMAAVPGPRLCCTRPPGLGRFTGGTVTCACISVTSWSHHRASAVCCARSAAARSRSSGIARKG